MTTNVSSSPPGRIAAIILAAGESSRMAGEVKALLPLAGTPALQRVHDAMCEANVDDIVVVAGYHAKRVIPAASALGMRVVENPEPQRGMFSSVITGATSLLARDKVGDPSNHTEDPPRRLDGFFILPVDYPLVTSRVLTCCIDALRTTDCEAVYPCCGGLRGHPPLLTATLLAPLAAGGGGAPHLRGFLEKYAQHTAEIEVDDLSVLLDMDTQDDFQRLERFASLNNATLSPTGQPVDGHATISYEDADYLLELLQTPPNVVAHCREVARVGGIIAAAVNATAAAIPGGAPVPAGTAWPATHPHRIVDAKLVFLSCLLHDLVRGQGARKHAQMAERILSALGLQRMAEVVGAHMVLPLDPTASPHITEEELVYLADKLVVENQLTGLEERERRALKKCGDDQASRCRIRTRMEVAEHIAKKVEAIVGRDIMTILS